MTFPTLRFPRLGLVVLTSVGLASGLVACRSDLTRPSGTGGGGGSDGGGGDDTSTSSGSELFCVDRDAKPGPACNGPDAAIGDLTTNVIGLDQVVTLKDVVVMSQKFLVSKSTNTGSCLWGVYVSEQVAETGPDTGMLILSYGSKAFIPVGDTVAQCPKLGQEPACDWIPDDVKPGDVLTVTGTSQIFPNPPTNCTGDDPDNQVGMRQLADVCHVERTGTAPVPVPHVLTPEEIEKIPSTDDAAFHSAWGAVKVRVENVGVSADGGKVVGSFGIIHLDDGIPVGGKLFYRPYSTNACHASPVFSNPDIVFSHIDGFHYLNFCSWGLDVNDKCADFVPRSEDCQTNLCQFDVMPPEAP